MWQTGFRSKQFFQLADPGGHLPAGPLSTICKMASQQGIFKIRYFYFPLVKTVSLGSNKYKWVVSSNLSDLNHGSWMFGLKYFHLGERERGGLDEINRVLVPVNVCEAAEASSQIWMLKSLQSPAHTGWWRPHKAPKGFWWAANDTSPGIWPVLKEGTHLLLPLKTSSCKHPHDVVMWL